VRFFGLIFTIFRKRHLTLKLKEPQLLIINTALHFSAHCPAIQAQGHYGKEKRQSESQPNIRKTVMPFQHGDEGRGWGEGGWEG